MMTDYSVIEKNIGYVFNNKKLLQEALTHSSFANENRTASYERLEFLGDSVLNYVTALLLFTHFPTKKEGEMTKIRAALVSEKVLSELAEKLKLLPYILFAKSACENPISQSAAVKCDVFEAVIGAVLLDSGNDLPFLTKLIENLLRPYLYIDYTDYKSLLLEIFAKNILKIIYI